MEQKMKRVVMGVGQQDLTAVKHMLFFYGRYLRSGKLPVEQRHVSLDRLQLTLLKVELVLRGRVIMLSWEDLRLIEQVITTFVALVREKIEASPTRDEVLASCEQLREYLLCVLPPKQMSLKGGGSAI
jgi:hypothetical protein